MREGCFCTQKSSNGVPHIALSRISATIVGWSGQACIGRTCTKLACLVIASAIVDVAAYLLLDLNICVISVSVSFLIARVMWFRLRGDPDSAGMALSEILKIDNAIRYYCFDKSDVNTFLRCATKIDETQIPVRWRCKNLLRDGVVRSVK